MYKKVVAFISALLTVVSLVGCEFRPKNEVVETKYGVGISSNDKEDVPKEGAEAAYGARGFNADMD